MEKNANYYLNYKKYIGLFNRIKEKYTKYKKIFTKSEGYDIMCTRNVYKN